MKIALAQLNYHIGNFEQNRIKIVEALKRAEIEKVELVVFSELSISGYPARDFLGYSGFIKNCKANLDQILPFTKKVDCILGCPIENQNLRGKSLFNAAIHLSQGKIKHIVTKTLLPNYDIFDEYRYFEPGMNETCIKMNDFTIALTICEDLWNIQNKQYQKNPMDSLIHSHPDIMINIAASPFHYSQKEEREQVLRSNVLQYQLPIIYVNQVGAQTDLIFDGGSLAMNIKGEILNSPVYFEESFEIFDTRALLDGSLNNKELSNKSGQNSLGKSSQKPLATLFPSLSNTEEIKQNTDSSNVYSYNPSVPIKGFFKERFSKGLEMNSLIQLMKNKNYLYNIHKALILGIKDFFRKSNFEKAVIGLSGGIDSALVAYLATEALGADQILLVLMPSQYSSEHSLVDGYALAEILGAKTETILIEPITKMVNEQLKPIFQDLPFSIAEENIQSRTRSLLLMAISNKLGYILLNTSNKSELAVGYGTLYGDLSGALSVIGDMYKTQIFALCEYLHGLKPSFPISILEKEPSAELRPNQKDTDSLPKYEILDTILWNYIEAEINFDQFLTLNYEPDLVLKTLNMVNKSEFKRYQAAPILRISPRAFGLGRRMPIEGMYETKILLDESKLT